MIRFARYVPATLVVTACLGGFFQCRALAAESTAIGQIPAILPLRYEEDWRAYQPPPSDALRLKSLHWNDIHLSFGLNARFRVDSLDSVASANGPTEETTTFSRVFAHAAIRGKTGWQGFVQVKTSLSDGRVGPTTGLDEDRFDVQQLLVDVPLFERDKSRALLRLGRQELSYGAARVVTARDGSNTRRSFDAARAIYMTGRWRWEALAARPVDTRTGTLDNRTDESRLLWGVYGSNAREHGSFDFYYLGLQRDVARTNDGTSDEGRHSVGTRWQWRREPTDLSGEAVFQFGSAGSREIEALGIVAEAGRRWSLRAVKVRSALRVSFASGDREVGDDRYNTAYLLFPPPLFFDQEGVQLAAANQYSIRPILQCFVSRHATVTLDAQLIRRASLNDGLYTTSGNLLVPPNASRARHVANQYNLQLDWQVSRAWSLTTAVSHVEAGEFLRGSLADRDLRFATAYASFAF
jgi:hypothetical protein